ncbi:hypothetical protein BJ878DRAFT_476769 [Calycina marina]|uniref:Voltage-gated hydrogen channel 1 n=1 Tax=Calycina marina TaxID=1763456 RepID=A0A9P7ZAC2_9HELO|nr:hypothetical protein BJ878DRAFT_476769 [Calycina marina]
MPSSSSPLLRAEQQEERVGAANPVSNSLLRRYLHNPYKSGRQKAKAFLSSKTQHWIILSLVGLDVLGIFADIIINLEQCRMPPDTPKYQTLSQVRESLAICGLVFSSMFVLELLISIWAFGLRYLNAPFHILDATVIVAGLAIDIVLHGEDAEVASLVVVLRLWRFLKIIEEFGVGAEEQMSALSKRLEDLEAENQELKSMLGRD